MRHKRCICNLRATGKAQGTSLLWCELTSSPPATSCTTPVGGAQREHWGHPTHSPRLRKLDPGLWSPGCLKPCSSSHTPTFLPVLHSVIRLLYERSLFWSEDLYSHKMTGNVWTTTSKKCCSGFAMSNSQITSEDLI